MRTFVIASIFAAASSVAYGQSSTWWHGSYVPADSLEACDSNDALVKYEADAVFPWETNCTITKQTELRDMLGVLLDIDCSYQAAPDEGYKDREAILELSNGNVMIYSRVTKRALEMRRCQSTEDALK